jgi:hypothetical protein
MLPHASPFLIKSVAIYKEPNPLIVGRAANESSRAELSLSLIYENLNRVELSRAREMLLTEKPNSNSAHYYSR